MKQTTQRTTSALLIALTIAMWAVPSEGTAFSFAQRRRPATIETRPKTPVTNSDEERGRRSNVPAIPAAARFREVEGRGLLVKIWINNSGPYSFAIDTGAGATIISKRVAFESRITFAGSHPVKISGLSGAKGAEGREATPGSLAIGARENFLPAKGFVIVTDALPPDLDGVLDPTESYWPLGYTINLPNNTITAFDPLIIPLRGLAAPPGGEIVQWLFEGESRRPFVMLDAGRRALLDTGSAFGLAISENAARSFGIASTRGRERAGVQDIGRGRINARRIEPITIQIGSLVLRRIPTDLLSGAAVGAPILLGRDALRPFEISFDPMSRLIRLRPVEAASRR